MGYQFIMPEELIQQATEGAIQKRLRVLLWDSDSIPLLQRNSIVSDFIL